MTFFGVPSSGEVLQGLNRAEFRGSAMTIQPTETMNMFQRAFIGPNVQVHHNKPAEASLNHGL
jgi:hypothetical protein